MPTSVCLQGLGAARVDSRRVVLWRRGVPSALLAVGRPAPQTAALGHRVQEQRVQEHPVSAAGGEVQRHVPAAEGEVQGLGQGKDRGRPGAPFIQLSSYLRRWVLVFAILTRFGPRSQILRSLSMRMSPSLRIFSWVFLKSIIQWWLTLDGWCVAWRRRRRTPRASCVSSHLFQACLTAARCTNMSVYVSVGDAHFYVSHRWQVSGHATKAGSIN